MIGASFALNVPRAWKSLWAHPMVHLCNVCQVKACFGPFGDVLISAQDRCMVCAERTIGLETILDAPDGTPTWRGSSGSLFWSVSR
jgi:hypothetical protein